jgi:hypothetical protein
MGVGTSIKQIGFFICQYNTKYPYFQLPTGVISTVQELSQPLALDQFSRGLLVLGGFVFAVSVLGYCGATRESRFLLVLVSEGQGNYNNKDERAKLTIAYFRN